MAKIYKWLIYFLMFILGVILIFVIWFLLTMWQNQRENSFENAEKVFAENSKALHALATDFWEQEHTLYFIRSKITFGPMSYVLSANSGDKNIDINIPKGMSETEYWNQPPEDIHDEYRELTLKEYIEEYNINLSELRRWRAQLEKLNLYGISKEGGSVVFMLTACADILYIMDPTEGETGPWGREKKKIADRWYYRLRNPTGFFF